MCIFFLNSVHGNFMLAIFTCYNIIVRPWKIRSKNLLIQNLCTVETKNMFSVSHKLFLYWMDAFTIENLNCVNHWGAHIKSALDVLREMWYGCNGDVLSFFSGTPKSFQKVASEKSIFYEASHWSLIPPTEVRMVWCWLAGSAIEKTFVDRLLVT